MSNTATSHPIGESAPWRFCVAPMMDWTDRHCRYFHRLLAPHARLYTEMITAAAIVHGDRTHLLQFDKSEHPIAVQLGGAEPELLAQAAHIAQRFGYDEINLNVGCPSDRVQSGRFGACLMREPHLVAECVAAMQAVVSIPITVKCRLGVDEQDEYADLERFINIVQATGCHTFIVHARKAWLQGLSPKENRDVPPLNYQRVYQLKRDFPHLTFIINGGISHISDIDAHLQLVDGVMLGRIAYHEPYRLAEIEAKLYGTPLPTREHVLLQLKPYIETHLSTGGRLQHITRHLLGLYQGMPGARKFRRQLSELAHIPNADFKVLEQALP